MTRTRVTTDGITDASVTTAKLADASVSTSKLIAQAVTYAKLQNVSVTNAVLGRMTAGAGVVEEISLTAAGRELINDADAAAQRTTLGLGTMATATAADYLPLTGSSTVTGATTFVGTTTVTGSLNASSDIKANNNVVSRRFATFGQFVVSRAEGDSTTPTVIAAGDCANILMQGYNGTGYVSIASIMGSATDVPTTVSSPGKLAFKTVPVGSINLASRMEIDSDGSQYTVIPGGTTLYPSFACRAWVNFNAAGTRAGSGNVSSVAFNGNGDYTVNFTVALPDVNYAAIGNAGGVSPNGDRQLTTWPISASQCRVASGAIAGTANYAVTLVCVAFFR